MPIDVLGNQTAGGLGSALAQQVEGETDEQRKKRLAQQAQQFGSPLSSALGLTKASALASVYGGAY